MPAAAVSAALRSRAVRKVLAAVLTVILVASALLSLAAAAAFYQLFYGSGGSGGSVSSTGSLTVAFSAVEPSESAFALAHIPGRQTSPSTVTFPILYAAATGNGVCTLPWSILAGVAAVESSFGTSRSPGVTGGHNAAGAEGPFQFEPATFAAYANPIPAFPGASRPPSTYDAADAAFAAARKLCEDGILEDQKLALWRYNAGNAGLTVTRSGGKLTVRYSTAPFAGKADNPARYVLDVLTAAARYGGGSTSGSATVPVKGLAPGEDVAIEGERTALWAAALASGASCQAYLRSSCFAAIPAVLGSYDGIGLPAAPSEMEQDLAPVAALSPGDVVLFSAGGHKAITNSVYGVVVDPASGQVALVRAGAGASPSTIAMAQKPGGWTVGSEIGPLTVRFIGSPFG